LQCSAPAVHRHRLHRPRLLSTAHMSTQAFAKWMDLQASDSSYRMSSIWVYKKKRNTQLKGARASLSFPSYCPTMQGPPRHWSIMHIKQINAI
jgi:hypothetical protein